MEKLGKELEFISMIKRDGSGVEEISDKHLAVIQDDIFRLTYLSLTEGTFIASEFNSYVVKLKK